MSYGSDSDYETEIVVECRARLTGVHGEQTIEVGEREYPLVCEFIGDVYAQVIVYEGKALWTCPQCGTVHEMVLHDSFDDDDLRDPYEF